MTCRGKRRYRRHRILGLLPALVLVVGSVYLGLAGLGWVGLVVGAAFLALSAIMIVTDHPPRPTQSTPLHVSSTAIPSTSVASPSAHMDDDSTHHT